MSKYTKNRNDYGYKDLPSECLVAVQSLYDVLVMLDTPNSAGRRRLRELGYLGRIITVEIEKSNHDKQIADADCVRDFQRGDLFQYLKKYIGGSERVLVWADLETSKPNEEDLMVLNRIGGHGIFNLASRLSDRNASGRTVDGRIKIIDKYLQIHAVRQYRRLTNKNKTKGDMMAEIYYGPSPPEQPLYTIDYITPTTQSSATTRLSADLLGGGSCKITRINKDQLCTVVFKKHKYHRVPTAAMFGKMKAREKRAVSEIPTNWPTGRAWPPNWSLCSDTRQNRQCLLP